MAKDAAIAVEVSDLVKTYGKVAAVDTISFDVPHGQIFAFLGPNGAGKSTTIKMLTTLLRPTSGRVLLNGYDVSDQQTEVRASIGIVFQDQSLDDDLTAYENMELHAVLYDVPAAGLPSQIMELLTLVGLNERSKSLVRTFSGGMKRRLEIARGLLHKPKILFLDEPTLGLDTQTRTVLWDYVVKLSRERGMTIFFTTHYLEEAQEVAERIALIDHGKIVAIGSTAELTKQTDTDSLEEAYLKYTGRDVRDESVSASDNFKARARSRHR